MYQSPRDTDGVGHWPRLAWLWGLGLLGLDALVTSALLVRGADLTLAQAAGAVSCLAGLLLASPLRSRLLARGVWMMLLALVCWLTLRGLLLSTLLVWMGQAWVACLVLACVQWLVLFVLPASLPRRFGPGPDRSRGLWLAAGLIGYLFVLRLLSLGQPGLLMEEAYYWNYANHLSPGYLDHPPMVALLIYFGTMLFGDTEFGVRLAALLCWIGVGGFGYALTRDMFGRLAGLWAVALLSVMPFFYAVGFFMTPDAPMTLFWAGTLYFLYHALVRGNSTSWIGVGVCLGLGMLSKYSIALIGPAIFVYLIADRRARHWLWHPMPYLAVVISVVLFTPVIWWNQQNAWASFAFQSVDRVQAPPTFGLHLLVGSAILLVTPLVLLATPSLLFGSRGKRLCASIPPNAGGPERARRFAAVFVLVPLFVFVVFSLQHEPKLNWTGPLWLAAVPLIACRVARLFESGASADAPSWARRAWASTFVAVALFCSLFFYHVSVGLPGVPYSKQFLLVGARDLGDKIEALEDAHEDRHNREPAVVGMDKYGTASLLAFYRLRDHHDERHHDPNEGVRLTTGAHLFGQNSLMYDYWAKPGAFEGKDIYMVARQANRLEGDNFAHYFSHLDAVKSIVVQSNGRDAGTYYYRVGYGYRSEQVSPQAIEGQMHASEPDHAPTLGHPRLHGVSFPVTDR